MMLSLQGLLQQIEGRNKALGQSFRAFLETVGEICAKLAKAKAEIERLRPLAEIGELVQEMHDGARLRRDGKTYWATLSGRVPVGACDPAEALRAIQATEEEE